MKPPWQKFFDTQENDYFLTGKLPHAPGNDARRRRNNHGTKEEVARQIKKGLGPEICWRRVFFRKDGFL